MIGSNAEDALYVIGIVREKIGQVLARSYQEGGFFSHYDVAPSAGRLGANAIEAACDTLVDNHFLEARPFPMPAGERPANIYRMVA